MKATAEVLWAYAGAALGPISFEYQSTTKRLIELPEKIDHYSAGAGGLHLPNLPTSS